MYAYAVFALGPSSKHVDNVNLTKHRGNLAMHTAAVASPLKMHFSSFFPLIFVPLLQLQSPIIPEKLSREREKREGISKTPWGERRCRGFHRKSVSSISIAKEATGARSFRFIKNSSSKGFPSMRGIWTLAP